MDAQTTSNAIADTGSASSGRLEHTKYSAFISYSHREMAAAQWLHQTIEKYRVPRRLVGREGRDGPIPRRLFPVFRDQEELAASSSLPQQIRDALYSSRALIVVCTPAAAQSKWVDEEMRTYKTLGRADRVLALIAAGEPSASESVAELECFPKSLRHVVDDQGRVTDEPAEPLAADIRGRRALRDLAKLRIIAGLLGVPYDELRQRDRQRRLQQRIVAGVGAVAVVLALAGTWFAQERRRMREVTAQTIYSLTNLGQKELLDGQPNRAAVLLSEAYQLGGRETRLRVLLAKALKTLDMRAPSLAQSDGEWGRVVLAPAGERLVAFGRTAIAKLWEPATGRLIKELAAHTGRINVAQFSPDGRLLFTAGDDHRLAIWDSATGELLKSATSHDTVINELIVSADGRWIATFGADKTRYLWPLSGLDHAVPLGANFRIESPAAFSPTDLVLVGYSSRRALLIWKLAEGSKPVSIASENQIESFAFSPGGDLILLADSSGAVRAFRSDTGEPDTDQPVIRTEAGLPVHISFVGDFLLVVDRDGTIQLWDARKNDKVRELTTGLRQVRVLDSRDGVLALLSIDAFPRLVVWDVRTGSNVAVDLDGVLPSAAAIDVHHHLLFSIADGAIAKWDLDRGAGNFTLAQQGFRINAIDFSPDGKRVLTADDEGYAIVWDAITGRVLHQLDHRKAALAEVQFSASGRRIMDRGRDGTIFFDGQTYALRKSLDDPMFRRFATSPALPPTVAVALRGSLMLWIDEEKSQTFDLDAFFGDVTAMSFSADGALLAVGYDDGSLKVYEMNSRKVVMSAWEHSAEVRWVSFAPGGDTLVSIAKGESVAIVWSIRQRSAISRLAGGSAPIEHARFSPDGARVITACGDGTSKIYDARSGRLLVSLEGHGGRVLDATFSPDGTLVATSAEDDFVRVWDAETGQLIVPFKAPGHINDVAFRPTGGTLAFGASSATTFLDIPVEGRTTEQVAALVSKESNWRLEQGSLVRKAATRSGAAGEREGSAAAERVLGSPEEVINAFISALEHADNDALVALLARNNKRPSLTRVGTEEQQGLGSLFKDCKITGTELRKDGLAAISTLDCESRELAIWTVKEGNGWKFQNFGARPRADGTGSAR